MRFDGSWSPPDCENAAIRSRLDRDWQSSAAIVLIPGSRILAGRARFLPVEYCRIYRSIRLDDVRPRRRLETLRRPRLDLARDQATQRQRSQPDGGADSARQSRVGAFEGDPDPATRHGDERDPPPPPPQVPPPCKSPHPRPRTAPDP